LLIFKSDIKALSFIFPEEDNSFILELIFSVLLLNIVGFSSELYILYNCEIILLSFKLLEIPNFDLTCISFSLKRKISLLLLLKCKSEEL
jgi:hypothetical protein